MSKNNYVDASGLNKYHKGLNTNKTSPLLTNTDVQNFKVGKGTVNGVSKDYSNQMMQSLITLDNIEGKTVKDEINNVLRNTELHKIYIKEVVNSNSNNLIIGDLEYGVCSYPDMPLGSPMSQIYTGVFNIRRALFTTPIDVEPNTTYTVKNFSSDKFHFTFFSLDENGCKNGDDIGWGNTVNTRTYTTGEHTRKIIIYTKLEDDSPISLATLKKAKITLVKGNSVNTYKEPKIKIKTQINPNVDLRSLPNGVCDNLIDGKMYTNTFKTVLDGTEFDWVHWKTENNIAVYYTRPGGVKPTADNINTGILCDKLPSLTYNETINPTKEGVSLYSGYNYIGVCIKSSTASNLEQFKTYLSKNPLTVITEYYDDWKIVTPLDLSILANSGDTICIDTPIPLICTHQVSLNTKSQIEETQKVVETSIKSIFDLKALVNNFKIEKHLIGNSGYIRLPSVLGGMIIQWGVVDNCPSNTITRVNFPIAFTSSIKYIGGVMQDEWYSDGGTVGSSNGVVCNGRDFTYFNIGHHFGQPRPLGWIAIGF